MRLNQFAAFFLSLILVPALSQVPGDLDPGFGDEGKKLIPIGIANAFGRAVAIQTDDKIVIAAISNNGIDTDFSVIRLTSDGELDQDFNGDGVVVTDFDSTSDLAQSISVDAFNRIVVGGYTFNGTGFDFGLVRYLPDGNIDESFGDLGKRTISLGTTAFAKSIIIQPDQKILIGGYTLNPLSGKNEFTIVRLQENGMLDANFDDDGINMTDFGFGSHVANAMVLQPDGKIVLAGQVFNESSFLWEIGIARYNSDGTLDNTWDHDGIAHSSLPLINSTINTVKIANDGKIIVGGYAGTAPSNNLFAIVRYHLNGQIDTSFGDEGKFIETFGFHDNQVTSMIIQPDGRILVGGYTLIGNANRFAIARIDQEGIFDTGFGINGISLTQIGQNDGIEAMALQSDGKLIVAGEQFDGNRFSVAVARFETGITTSFEPISNISSSLVYPNPALPGSQLFIRGFEAPLDKICLFDIHGHIVKILSIDNFSTSPTNTVRIILPENITPGLYYLHSLEDKMWSEPIFIQ